MTSESVFDPLSLISLLQSKTNPPSTAPTTTVPPIPIYTLHKPSIASKSRRLPALVPFPLEFVLVFPGVNPPLTPVDAVVFAVPAPDAIPDPKPDPVARPVPVARPGMVPVVLEPSVIPAAVEVPLKLPPEIPAPPLDPVGVADRAAPPPTTEGVHVVKQHCPLLVVVPPSRRSKI